MARLALPGKNNGYAAGKPSARFGYVLVFVLIALSVLLVGCGSPDVTNPEPATMDSVSTPMPEPDTPDTMDSVLTPTPEPEIEMQVSEPELVLPELTVPAPTGGTVSVECDGECQESQLGDGRAYSSEPGLSVRVSATPDEGYTFLNWDCTGFSCPLDTVTNPIGLSLYNNVSLTARLEAIEGAEPPYGLVIENPDSGGIAIASCEPNCLYEEDSYFEDRVHIYAVAEDGYEFEGWLCEGTNCVDAAGGPIGVPFNPLELPQVVFNTRVRLSPVFRDTTTDSAMEFSYAPYDASEESQFSWNIESLERFHPQDARIMRELIGDERGTIELTPDEEQVVGDFIRRQGYAPDEQLQLGELVYVELAFVDGEIRIEFELKKKFSPPSEDPSTSPFRDSDTPVGLMRIQPDDHIIIRYAVVNQTPDGDTEMLQRIVKSSVEAWENLNPYFDFQDVTSEYPELPGCDQRIDSSCSDIASNSYAGLDLRVTIPSGHGGLGRRCSGGCFRENNTLGNITMAYTKEDGEDENVSFCGTQGHLPGLSSNLLDTMKHEIGHYLGLEHNIFNSHLLNGYKPLIEFDDLGYSIPDPHTPFQFINGRLSPEEASELSNRIEFLEERVSLGYLRIPTGNPYADLERMRLDAERGALERELGELNIRLRCGEADPEYAG